MTDENGWVWEVSFQNRCKLHRDMNGKLFGQTVAKTKTGKGTQLHTDINIGVYTHMHTCM